MLIRMANNSHHDVKFGDTRSNHQTHCGKWCLSVHSTGQYFLTGSKDGWLPTKFSKVCTIELKAVWLNLKKLHIIILKRVSHKTEIHLSYSKKGIKKTPHGN